VRRVPDAACVDAVATTPSSTAAAAFRRAYSKFAATPGLRLPFGYHGHHKHDRVPVQTVEHWFHACKATSRQQFDMILACGTAAGAKHAAAKRRCVPTGNKSNTR
jgi:hypothetical protein